MSELDSIEWSEFKLEFDGRQKELIDKMNSSVALQKSLYDKKACRRAYYGLWRSIEDQIRQKYNLPPLTWCRACRN